MESRKVINQFSIDGFCTAFRFDWDSQFVFQGERHGMWEIVFLTAGRVEVTEDGKVYVPEAGDIILHAPMEFHRIRSSGGTSPSGYILSFYASGELPSELKNGIFRLSGRESEAYEDICRRSVSFVGQSEEDAYAGQEVVALLSAFLIRLARGRTADATLLTGGGAAAYRRLVSEMTKAAETGAKLTDIAAACYVSMSYLKVLFRKYAGIGPKEYYTNLRLQKANELLQTGYSAAEIAERMGFSSPNYFSSFFKKHTGKTPSEYRRSL